MKISPCSADLKWSYLCSHSAGAGGDRVGGGVPVSSKGVVGYIPVCSPLCAATQNSEKFGRTTQGLPSFDRRARPLISFLDRNYRTEGGFIKTN